MGIWHCCGFTQEKYESQVSGSSLITNLKTWLVDALKSRSIWKTPDLENGFRDSAPGDGKDEYVVTVYNI
jgi:hypothetical protein